MIAGEDFDHALSNFAVVFSIILFVCIEYHYQESESSSGTRSGRDLLPLET